MPTRAHTDLLEDPQHVFGAISHHQKHWYILLSLLLRIRARSHMDIQSTHGGFMPTLYGPHFISPQTCVKHSLGARYQSHVLGYGSEPARGGSPALKELIFWKWVLQPDGISSESRFEAATKCHGLSSLCV